MASNLSVLREAGWESLQTRRSKHKLIKFHSMYHCSTPLYLSDLVPRQTYDVHGRDTRNRHNLYPIHCRTQKYQNSFLPSIVSSWNNIPLEIRNNPSVNHFKHFLNDSDYHVPSYFFSGSRLGQIYHSRLRTESSSLKSHLFMRNIVNNATCACGALETTKHFLLECPLFNSIRISTIETLPRKNVELLLYGDVMLPNHVNSQIFSTVHEFLIKSKRFAT